MDLRNFPVEYAAQYGIPGQAITEEGWAFRERVARTLERMFLRVEAHEVLYNQDERGNPWARGELSSGYGDAHITRIARCVEAEYQATLRDQGLQQRRAVRRARMCHALRQLIAGIAVLRERGANLPWWLIFGAIVGLLALAQRGP
jgi:hypothetical protein